MIQFPEVRCQTYDLISGGQLSGTHSLEMVSSRAQRREELLRFVSCGGVMRGAVPIVQVDCAAAAVGTTELQTLLLIHVTSVLQLLGEEQRLRVEEELGLKVRLGASCNTVEEKII